MPASVQQTPPFRAEVIGSLLRPRALKDAGRALQEGRLPMSGFEALRPGGGTHRPADEKRAADRLRRDVDERLEDTE